jgi:hypothetical protein
MVMQPNSKSIAERRYSPDRKFVWLHVQGARKFGSNWLTANIEVVNIARGFGVDPVQHKLALSHLAWRMLLAGEYIFTEQDFAFGLEHVSDEEIEEALVGA